MLPNLISQLTNAFKGDGINKIASALGESPVRAQTALSAALPALFGSLANQASTSDGANKLLDLMRQNNFDSNQFSDVSKAVASPDSITNLMNVGRPLLDSVLGARTDSITEWVSSHAGISRSSGSSLLSLALPMVLGFISRKVSAAGGGVSNLMELLSGQRAFLHDAPAGLAGALGFSQAAAAAGDRPFVGTYEPQDRKQPVVGTYQQRDRGEPVVAYEAEPLPGGSSWWKWALPLLALVGLIGWFVSQRPTEEGARARLSDTARSLPAINLGAFIPRSLPGGVTLNIPTNGVESKLVAFIEDPSRQVDKETWFSFDRLEFETGSAQLKPSSQEQLRNVAEILKAYPKVNVKIGGYTDNTGDDASNLKLSADRATNTMNEIASLGVDRFRLEAEGYGEQFPIADNGTEEGRQRNRRIDIRVTQK